MKGRSTLTRSAPMLAMPTHRWSVPMAVLALFVFLLQPALCWPALSHGAAPLTVSAAQASSGADESMAGSHETHGSTECCTNRSTAGAEAPPMRSAPPPVLPAFVPRVPSVDQSVPSAPLASLRDGARPPALSYHARSARRLI
ncbi:MAG: hypothetical protein M0015_04895 [Betaproteobacteria bacterium]|nr:hypothetical protein [Betaproteobacteria bacterium]